MSSADFDLCLPASSANLGPAFDTAALALDLWLRVRAQTAKSAMLAADGRDADVCSNPHDHLILDVYRQTLQAQRKRVQPLSLQLENEIPVGKGCGSSAAARLAGIALACHFGGLGWDAQRIFQEAARLEGHADNAAACWWGGLIVTRSPADEPLRWLKVGLGARWAFLLAVPPQPLATSQARAVLPSHISREDAVANVQNTAMLVQAFQQGRSELLAAAFRDRMHQPYRAALCPLLAILQPLVGSAGILGCALSGAGPSVLLVVRNAADMPKAKISVSTALRKAGAEAELLATQVALRGPGLEWPRRGAHAQRRPRRVR